MPLQDLTPQLRARLNRMERVVGVFVLLATLLLTAGFAYYLYHTAVRRGWFLQKVPYYVYVEDASGLKVGDPVRMMGFEIGRITEITPMPPEQWFVDNKYNVFVQFRVTEPNYGYIWTDSRVRVNPGDILGNRQLEVIKGQTGAVTVVETRTVVTDILDDKTGSNYVTLTAASKGVWLHKEETPQVTEQVNRLISAIEGALPQLTNQLTVVLQGTSGTLSNINELALEGRNLTLNLGVVAARLREPGDSLGRWLFPSNFPDQLEATLDTAQSTLTGVNTNLAQLVEQVAVSLDNLSLITSNLNAQVQANTNILSDISQAVIHTDELVRGLKRHWFLRSAFKEKPAPPRH